MPGRLTDTISELVGADQLERLSVALQTTPATASSSLRNGVDAIVAGLADVAAPAGGTTRLGAMLDREGITAIDRLDEALERGEDVEGAQLAREILGERTDSVAAALETSSGLTLPGAGLRALGFAAPLAVSTLARRQRDESLTAAGIGALLLGERTAIGSSLAAPGSVPTAAAGEAQLNTKALAVTREETARHEVEERRRRKYAWPFIFLFALVGVVIAIVLATTLGGDDEPAATPEPTTSEPAAAEPPAPAPPEEPELPLTVMDIAESDGGFSTLLEGLGILGLDATLRGAGPFTMLAPTDAAFDGLPDGALAGLLAEPDRLRELLAAHVLEGTHTKEALAARADVTTQDGRTLTVGGDGETVAVNGSTIVKPDQAAQNGILHSVDVVIVPDGFELIPAEPTTVVEITTEAGSFSTLLGALETANLTTTLSGEGPFTVFAPTDEAFAALPDGVLDATLANPAALEQLLTAHVAGGVQRSSELAERADITTLTGQILPIAAAGDGLSVGGSIVTTPDLEADNGIVHVIDSVIFPEGLSLGTQDTVIDVLGDAGNFTTFLDSLELTDQTTGLRRPGPFTVFAPTDDAFDALPEAVQTRLFNDPVLLQAVLVAHYANGAVEAVTIAENDVFRVASGEDISVVTDDDLIWLGGARITESLNSGNAVVHVLDRVVIPPSFGAAGGTVNELLALAPVQFEVASAELTDAGRRVLSRAVAYLRTNPVSVEIGGHTDSDGRDAANLTLSEARAQTVFDFLAGEGVSPASLTAVGYGETQPVATNATDRGKARNRRIDFTILG